MAELTPSETAILGLLAERPMHGYELDDVIAARGMRAWTEIGFSSIYFLLQKLQKKGLVRQEGRPATPKGRKAYAITDAGRTTLGAACLDLLAAPDAGHASVLVGLANWPALDPAAAGAALAERRTRIAGELAALEGRRRAQRPPPAFVDALFSYGVKRAEAELAWLDETIAALGGGDGETGSQEG